MYWVKQSWVSVLTCEMEAVSLRIDVTKQTLMRMYLLNTFSELILTPMVMIQATLWEIINLQKMKV